MASNGYKGVVEPNLMSTSTYCAMRSSGIFTHPSELTLRDYTQFIQACTNFSDEVNIQLQREAKIDSIASSRQYICLVFDEVKSKKI